MPDQPAAGLEEAIARFDAANLAWGQFWVNVWLKRPASERGPAAAVRETLGEAAISVPQDGDLASLAAFAAALRRAAVALRRFMEATSAQAPVTSLPGDLRESIDLLQKAAAHVDALIQSGEQP